jgi:hypothetical protein
MCYTGPAAYSAIYLRLPSYLSIQY